MSGMLSAKGKRVLRGGPVDEPFIAKVVALRKQGMKQVAIAIEMGVTQATISVILRKCGLSGGLVRPPRRKAWVPAGRRIG